METSEVPVRGGGWRPRFTLGTMMLVFLVASMTAVGGRFLQQAMAAPQTTGRAFFVMSILMLPMIALFIANAAVWALRRLK